jgi:malate dehydrogenase (oxaloacetate-decarboxylating)(NADP+)
MGTGSAGVGVAKHIIEYFIKEGLTEDEARRCFWMVDTKGLMTNSRGDKLGNFGISLPRPASDNRRGPGFQQNYMVPPCKKVKKAHLIHMRG